LEKSNLNEEKEKHNRFRERGNSEKKMNVMMQLLKQKITIKINPRVMI
jgi:hypothetical protein